MVRGTDQGVAQLQQEFSPDVGGGGRTWMGGTQARIQDFLKGGGGGEDIQFTSTHPLDIVRVTSSAP